MDELISELKSHRERMGLSLQDLFQRTRINVTFLEALEEGNFEILPDAYVKLFLKRYAQEVKLDGDEIVRRFEQLHWKATATEAGRPQRSDGLPGWVVGVAAVLVLGLVGAFVALRSESNQTTTQPVTPETARTPPPKLAASRPIQTPAPLEPSASLRPRTEPGISPETVAASGDLVTTPPIDTGLPDTDLSDTGLPDTGETETEPADESSTSTQVQTSASEALAQNDSNPDVLPETASFAFSNTPAAEAPQPIVADTQDETHSEPVVSGYSLSIRQDLTATAGNLNLSAEVLEATRITVTSDGEPLFDELIDAGRKTGWEARDRFMIEIQNGASVKLRLQDEDLPRVGTSGQKVRLFVSRSSIWVEEIEA